MKIVDKRTTPFTHYIGRGSAFGNPFTHLPLAGTKAYALAGTKAYAQVGTIQESVTLFRQWAHGDVQFDKLIPPAVRMRLLTYVRRLPADAVLGCYGCKPVCHGDVIIELWNEMHSQKEEVR